MITLLAEIREDYAAAMLLSAYSAITLPLRHCYYICHTYAESRHIRLRRYICCRQPHYAEAESAYAIEILRQLAQARRLRRFFFITPPALPYAFSLFSRCLAGASLISSPPDDIATTYKIVTPLTIDYANIDVAIRHDDTLRYTHYCFFTLMIILPLALRRYALCATPW